MYAVCELWFGHNGAPEPEILCHQPVQPGCESRQGAVRFCSGLGLLASRAGNMLGKQFGGSPWAVLGLDLLAEFGGPARHLLIGDWLADGGCQPFGGERPKGVGVGPAPSSWTTRAQLGWISG
jgi:hypothetical protein